MCNAEEYAREMIKQEELHIDEIDKMLRRPGQIEISKEADAIASNWIATSVSGFSDKGFLNTP